MPVATPRNPETATPARELRRGWTTGACAAAAARAAYAALLTGRFPDPVTIELPGRVFASFSVEACLLGHGGATATVVKDAGDDPDVTHGALVRVTVEAGPPGRGVSFRAGEGVGRVTLPGLPLAPGEPAINPAPREMIRRNLAAVADEHGVALDLVVTVAIPGGEALAAKTANPRLGIEGGLSILGTTGRVIPYSCAAWVHSIHRGIDVARASGLAHLGAATGERSEAGLRALLGLPERAMIEMGDFAGATLKYLRRHPVARLSIGGGFGKLSKLAGGALDLHSSRSSVDVGALAEMLAGLRAEAAVVDAARAAPSAGAVLAIARRAGLPLATRVAERARETALATLPGDIAVDVVVFDRAGEPIGHAGL